MTYVVSKDCVEENPGTRVEAGDQLKVRAGGETQILCII